jgi:hypothetical protein
MVLMQQEERHAAEMIAMQVAEEDRVDPTRIDAEAAHADQRGGAAVDQKPFRARGHREAGLQPSAAAERITATENPDPHPGHLRSVLLAHDFPYDTGASRPV